MQRWRHGQLAEDNVYSSEYIAALDVECCDTSKVAATVSVTKRRCGDTLSTLLEQPDVADWKCAAKTRDLYLPWPAPSNTTSSSAGAPALLPIRRSGCWDGRCRRWTACTLRWRSRDSR